MTNGSDDIERRIIEVLQSTPATAKQLRLSARWSRNEWTDLIKSQLSKLGSALGFKINSCHGHEEWGAKADWGEWLWDLTWVDYDEQRELTRELVLIVESEWDANDTGVDFEKLKVGRARYRLMVFRGRNSDAIAVSMKYFKCLVEGYRGTIDGDRYLFAGYNLDEGRFEVDHYVAGR